MIDNNGVAVCVQLCMYELYIMPFKPPPPQPHVRRLVYRSRRVRFEIVAPIWTVVVVVVVAKHNVYDYTSLIVGSLRLSPCGRDTFVLQSCVRKPPRNNKKKTPSPRSRVSFFVLLPVHSSDECRRARGAEFQWDPRRGSETDKGLYKYTHRSYRDRYVYTSLSLKNPLFG